MITALFRETPQPSDVVVSVHNRSIDSTARAVAEAPGTTPAGTLAESVRDADVVLLGVKPGDLASVAAPLRALAEDGTLDLSRTVFLSILAGVTADDLRGALGPAARVVVSMPTMLVAYQRAPLIVSGAADDVAAIEQIFGRTGDLFPVAEAELKRLTVFFGCLPGYLDTIVDAMLTAANTTCVGRRDAKPMLGQALLAYGAAMQVPGYVPGALAQSVESPRGLTAELDLSLKSANVTQVFIDMYRTGLDWPGWNSA